VLIPRLEHHIRKEARLLVRDAKRLRKAGEHEPAIAAVEKALSAKDKVALRAAMPALDEAVEDMARTRKLDAKYQAQDGLMWVISLVVLVFTLRTFVVQVFQIPSSSMYPTLMIGDHLFVNKFIYGLDIPFSDAKLATRSPSRGEIIVFAQPCTPDRDYIKRVVALAGDTVEVRCNRVYVNGKANEEALVNEPSCSYDDRDDGGEWHTIQCSRYRESAGGYTYETFHDPDRPARDPLKVGDELDFPNLRDPSPKFCGSDPLTPPAKNQAQGQVVQVKSGADACELQTHYVVPEGHVFVMGDNRAHSNDSRFWGSVPLENIRGKAMFIWLSYRELPGSIRFWRMGNFVHHSD
jgi:signal peptidase I